MAIDYLQVLNIVQILRGVDLTRVFKGTHKGPQVVFGSAYQSYEMTNQDLKKSINDYFQYTETELMILNSGNQTFFEVTSDKIDLEAFSRYFRLANQRNLKYIDWSWLKNPESKEYKHLENRISS